MLLLISHSCRYNIIDGRRMPEAWRTDGHEFPGEIEHESE